MLDIRPSFNTLTTLLSDAQRRNVHVDNLNFELSKEHYDNLYILEGPPDLALNIFPKAKVKTCTHWVNPTNKLLASSTRKSAFQHIENHLVCILNIIIWHDSNSHHHWRQSSHKRQETHHCKTFLQGNSTFSRKHLPCILTSLTCL